MKRFASHFVGLLAWMSFVSFAFPAAALAQGNGNGVSQEVAALKVRMAAAEARLGAVETLAAAQATQIAALQAEKVPVGTIIAYSSETPPPGYLECDGSPLSRTDYAGLFAAIGTAFGEGDGASTFNIPDLRGQFLRGWAHGTPHGFDPDRNSRFPLLAGGAGGDHVGSAQREELRSHAHTIQSGALNPLGNFNSIVGGNAIGFAFQSTFASGGNETRPWNVAVMYAIKH